MPDPVFILHYEPFQPLTPSFLHSIISCIDFTDCYTTCAQSFNNRLAQYDLHKSTMSLTDETSPVEQLFLDRSIHDVLTKKWPAVEPWATMYVDAIREQRYGDAVWARYHIEGNVENGIIISPSPSDNMPVLDSIREDAVEAKMNEPEFYAKALHFYAKTSPSDGHPEVIKVIFDADTA